MLRKEHIILAITAVYLFFWGAGSFCQQPEVKYVPGEIVVKLRPNVAAIPFGDKAVSAGQAQIRSITISDLNSRKKLNKIKRAITRTGEVKRTKTLRSGKTVTLPDLSDIFVFEFPGDLDVMKAVDEYRKDPDVIYAEPNYVLYAFITPDDPFYASDDPSVSPNQWGLYKIGLEPTGSGESGWDIEVGTNTVTVAVVDTGIYYNHEDLAGRAFSGYDFINNDSDASDDNGHGTHVAGIIGAKTNNTKGVAGVDWNCRLMAVKCLSYDGWGTDTEISNGIIYAVDNGADVINMSLGSYSDSSLIADAVSYASTSEVVIVAAAGNSNVSAKVYPAGYDDVLAVAAIGPEDIKTNYSNYGTWVDVSAPGGDGPSTYTRYILSTYTSSEGTDRYAWLYGTSMAAPFVSGLAALLKAQNPSWTKSQIDEQIKSYSDDINEINPSYSGLLGSGRIHATLALGGIHSGLSSPASGSTGYGVINVMGTATGEGFDHYTLEYGLGSSPTSWVTVETSNSAKLKELLGSFDTSGTSGDYTVKLSINDLATTETTVTFQVGASHRVIVLSEPENGPNPFNPLTDSTMIKYELSANAGVQIYIFSVSGTMIRRMVYTPGLDGGKQGINRVYWDGKDNYGNIVSNGIYLYRIADGTRVLAKGKIIVLK